MLKAKRTVSKKNGKSDKEELETAKNEVQTKSKSSIHRTLRSNKKAIEAVDESDKLPLKENSENEQNKKKYVPKLPVKVYGDNSSFFDSVYHAFKKDKEEKVKLKRKTQRDRVKAVKNVEVSTPKNRLKRKCDLHFDISPITLRNATIDLASFECDEEPVNKSPKLTQDDKSPEIAEQVGEEDLFSPKTPESKNTRSESHKKSSIEIAGDSSNIPEQEGIPETYKESIKNKTLESVEQRDETSLKMPQSAKSSLAVPESSITVQNRSKSLEKSLTVPELDNSSFNDPELSVPPSKVSKIDNNKDDSSFVIPVIDESIENEPEKDKSKHKVVQFIDAPEENKASELEVSKINENITLRPGKWRRSLAAWRKSHNPAKVINRTSRRFVALFPIRTDPGVLEGYKRRLHETLEKCKYILILKIQSVA
ncbi:transcriptional regulator ATRX homolog [Chironomus tepperi]|uniref:transcriptional regulator ATRX homolog n=1 Tax=Chironomus tepperi TaxID=113505 RepID=UPI00391F10F7